MYFNCCLNLSKKAINTALKDGNDDYIGILLYQDSDGNNDLVRSMLLEWSDVVNCATGDTKVFTFIDKKWMDLTISGNEYDSNRMLLSKTGAYNKMLFIGMTFGIGYNYPALIIYKPKTDEHVSFSFKDLKFNNVRELINLISELVLEPMRLGLPLDECYEWASNFKINSKYRIPLDKLDLIGKTKYNNSEYLIEMLIKNSGLDQNQIASQMGISSSYISMWKSSRKPSSEDLRKFVRIVGSTCDEANLLLNSFNYARLNPVYDRKLIEELEANNYPKKVSIKD